jgi:hypothetical protein
MVGQKPSIRAGQDRAKTAGQSALASHTLPERSGEQTGYHDTTANM